MKRAQRFRRRLRSNSNSSRGTWSRSALRALILFVVMSAIITLFAEPGARPPLGDDLTDVTRAQMQGALRSLKDARVALEHNDIELARHHIFRAEQSFQSRNE